MIASLLKDKLSRFRNQKLKQEAGEWPDQRIRIDCPMKISRCVKLAQRGFFYLRKNKIHNNKAEVNSFSLPVRKALHGRGFQAESPLEE